jgi:hypothetical protein
MDAPHEPVLNERLFVSNQALVKQDFPKDLRLYIFRILFNIYVINFIDSEEPCEKKIAELCEIISHYMKSNKRLMFNGRLQTHNLLDFKSREIAENITIMLVNAIKDVDNDDVENWYEEYNSVVMKKNNLVSDYFLLVENIIRDLQFFLINNTSKNFEKYLDILVKFQDLDNCEGCYLIARVIDDIYDLLTTTMIIKFSCYFPSSGVKNCYAVDIKKQGFINFYNHFVKYSSDRNSNLDVNNIAENIISSIRAARLYNLESNDNILKLFDMNNKMCDYCLSNVGVFKKQEQQHKEINLKSLNFADLKGEDLQFLFSKQGKLEIWHWLLDTGICESKCINSFLRALINS